MDLSNWHDGTNRLNKADVSERHSMVGIENKLEREEKRGVTEGLRRWSWATLGSWASICGKLNNLNSHQWNTGHTHQHTHAQINKQTYMHTHAHTPCKGGHCSRCPLAAEILRRMESAWGIPCRRWWHLARLFDHLQTWLLLHQSWRRSPELRWSRGQCDAEGPDWLLCVLDLYALMVEYPRMACCPGQSKQQCSVTYSVLDIQCRHLK